MRGGHGWVCAVQAREVRPFWGRAAGIFLLCLVSGYLAIASAVVVGFRATGVSKVGWLDVAWPGRWERVAPARAGYFIDRAARYMQESNFGGAELALQSALHLNPGNYEGILFLAQLRHYQKEFFISDAVFERLLDTFPERGQETAVARHDALLTRQRFAELAGLSLRMATQHPAHAPPWIRSALFALSLEPNLGDVLGKNAAAVAALPTTVVALLRAEELGRSGSASAATQLLTGLPGTPLPPYVAAEYVVQLLRLNERDLAEAFLRRHSPGLSPLDQEFFRMRIDQASGDTALVRLDSESLLTQPLSRATVDRLAAWLVEHPDARSFQRLDQLMRKDENRPAITGWELWVAAVACDAEQEADFWAQRAGAGTGDPQLSGKTIRFRAGDLTDPGAVHRLIATGSFPREVMFSLIQRASAAKR